MGTSDVTLYAIWLSTTLSPVDVRGDGTEYEISFAVPNQSLTSAVIPGYIYGGKVTAIAEEGFNNCTKLVTVSLPSTLTRINDVAFQSCDALTGVTIPSGVTYIGKSAFAACLSLKTVTVEATTPPSAGTDIFANCNASLVIRVPAASLVAYKAAAGWSTYASRIVGY
jgi:hypothetical protein